jgi:hypothetical protein
MYAKFRQENVKGDHLEDPGLDGNMMGGGCWLDPRGPGERQAAGRREHGSEPRVPQKAGNLLTTSVTISFSIRTLLHRVSYQWMLTMSNNVSDKTAGLMKCNQCVIYMSFYLNRNVYFLITFSADRQYQVSSKSVE